MVPYIRLEDERASQFFHAISKHKQSPGPLMPTLQDAQRIFGCVPLEIQKIIAKELKESIAKINGVVTFYSQFSLTPKGKNTISVCLGTACYVKGSQGILDAFMDELKIKNGETTKDGMYTLEATRCIGACGLAPVFCMNERVCGRANVQKAKAMLQSNPKLPVEETQEVVL
ncbi:MAG: NAD(P)H-dependent oxidoreductase subunit E [Candidatus Cloacimonetes bacterium]|jgi:NADH:ubiquinone oxidoreductase subunit E|nr:NAD(P)H-dependent oxidoreductase subunit E [Candidatus Cloacimonadota bacterium]MDY0338951.1 NAD(P)H-dependent oxidoreductase subunit E [Acholeplasmataceae bacterium]